MFSPEDRASVERSCRRLPRTWRIQLRVWWCLRRWLLENYRESIQMPKSLDRYIAIRSKRNTILLYHDPIECEVLDVRE